MSSNETRRRLRELAGEEVTVPAGLVSNVMRAVGERAAAARAALTPTPGTLRVVRPMLLSEGRGGDVGGPPAHRPDGPGELPRRRQVSVRSMVVAGWRSQSVSRA